MERSRAESTRAGWVAPRDQVFRQQVVFTGAVAAVSALVLLLDVPGGGLPTTTAFTWGLFALLGVTVAAAVAPWSDLDPQWRMLLPLADIVVCDVLRVSRPDAGFGFLMVLPALWLAGSFGRRGAVAAAAAVVSVLSLQTFLERMDLIHPTRVAALPATGSLLLTLVIMTGIVATTRERLQAQRALLRRQSIQLEEALAHSRDEATMTRSVLNAVPFYIGTLDAEGRTVQANAAYLAMLEELGLLDTLGEAPMYAADGVNYVRMEDRPAARGLRGEDVSSTMVWLGHPGSPRRALDVSGHLVMREDGSLSGLVFVARDITDEIAKARERDDFVSGLAHEFRTPLSSVLGYLELALEDTALADATRDQLEVALRNTERVQNLVGDMLISRAKDAQPTTEIHRAELDVTTVVEEAVTSLRPVAYQRLVTLESDTTGEALVLADDFRIRQVLDNLLSNAIKYNVSGGRVDVTVRSSPDDVTIAVADTGPGMSEEERRTAFEPFFRSASVRSSDTVGTGLGLGICRDLVLQHGGTIDIQSQLGVGTTVTVALPSLARSLSPEQGQSR